MTPHFKRRLTALAITAFIMLIADQYTKFLSVRHLTPAIREPIAQGKLEPGLVSELAYFFKEVRDPCIARRCDEVVVVDGFWTFHYRENRGAAFSLLANAPESIRIPFFVLSTIAALIFIIVYLRNLPADKLLLPVALVLVASGAVGNLVDRLYLGYVIDFIHWYVGDYHWPTFNIADSAITVGAVLLGYDAIFTKEPKDEAAKKKAPAAKEA